MLYDPRWDNPLTAERVIGWLESMPAEKAYDFHNCHGGCLWDQYLTAVGVGRDGNLQKWSVPFGVLHRSPYRAIASTKPHTFGAALKRARAELRPIPSTITTKT